jgi:hypothetical protein
MSTRTIDEAQLLALQELLAWWQERKGAIEKSNDANRQTERCTFHVEKRWLAAIKRQADLDALTYTQDSE